MPKVSSLTEALTFDGLDEVLVSQAGVSKKVTATTIKAGLATEGYVDTAISGINLSGAGISLDTTNFNGNLSAADTNVQLAIETLDDLVSGSAPSGLEAINEGFGLGWRLIGKDPAKAGTIGWGAVDFRESDFNNTTDGATGDLSFAINYQTRAEGFGSLAQGWMTIASGNYAVSTGGDDTQAIGDSSFASGRKTRASAYVSQALGEFSQATGYAGFAANYQTTASGNFSASFGNSTVASGIASVSLGNWTSAIGNNSFAYGNACEAQAVDSFAGGTSSVAAGASSTALGNRTYAPNAYQTVIGTYNVGSSLTSLFEIGIGPFDAARANAFEVHNDGMVVMPNLPTADPLVAGALWNNNGVLSISAG